ncbi:ATP-dependent helicase HrpB [Bdellovibrionota bacterium FG-2]
MKKSLRELPIDDVLSQVLEILEQGSCLVLQAAPGAGKTTRVPAALLEARFRRPHGEILVLEPRRLAAKMAARRVAEECGESVGETIGYQFRFANVTSPKTCVRFLTEGMLMRRLLSDPLLRNVDAVILDEFHERHLHSDVALAFLRRLQLSARPELRLCVMSATLDAASVARYLGNCPVLNVQGREFPVSVEYLPKPSTRPLELLIKDAVGSAVGAGDVLVFLSGMADIRRAQDVLRASYPELIVVALHGELRREEQDLALRQANRQKVILSTNVAETSLTIEGIATVVDSGLAKIASYSWWSGLPALRTRSISRASAIQRAGRAGRTAPGRCLRLYTKGDFEGRAMFDIPEIARADLSQTLLELKSLGVQNLAEFAWFERPPENALQSAQGLLYRLGAVVGAGVAESGEITPLGKRIVHMPIHPRLARLVCEADKRGCLREGATLAALLSEDRISDRNADRYESVDVLEQLRRYRPQRLGDRFWDDAVARVRDRLMEGRGAAPSTSTKIDNDLAFAVLCGFPDRVARKRTLGNHVTRGSTGRGDPKVELVFSSGGSALLDDSALAASAEYFVATDVEERKAQGQVRAKTVVRSVVSIEPEWLFDLEPEGISESEDLEWDPARERMQALSRINYGQLVLSEKREDPRDLEAAALLLSAKILEGGIDKICDHDALSALASLRARVGFLREGGRGDGLAWPEWNDEGLRETLVTFCEGRFSFAELRASDLPGFLLSQLSSEQMRKLETHAPAQVPLLRGRRVKVHYENGKPPWIESRLQDFFGMSQGPSVLGGRIPLTLHLLAPNQRAVQVTADLAGFWERVYPTLRRELGRRYPRHAWPENPRDLFR